MADMHPTENPALRAYRFIKRFFADLDKGLLPILLTVFLLAFGMSFVLPLIPLVIRDAGGSPSAIGQIASVYFLTFTLVTPFVGKWIDKIGSKKIIMTGIFLQTLAILVMVFLPSVWYFYTVRIVHAVGSACLYTPTESAINILSRPERRGSNMGLYALVFAGGFAVGPPIGTWLYTYDKVIPFALCSAVCLAGLVVLWKAYEDVKIPSTSSKVALREFLFVLKLPMAAALCYAVVEVSMAGFLALYLDALGIRGAAIGVAFLFFALGGIASPYPAGLAADRFGKTTSLNALGILLGVVTFLFNMENSYGFLLLLTFGVGVVAGGLYPIALSLIGDRMPPDKMGVANSTFSFCYGLGSIFGPICTGWAMEIFGIKYLFYPMTVAALVFVGIAIIDILRKQSNARLT
jgi:MFS family permease